jgi:hypothetical protein
LCHIGVRDDIDVTNSALAQTTSGRRPRDMLLSMLVLLVPIVLIIGLFQFLGGDREVTVVDPAPAVAEARQAGLAVAAPRGLPSGWRPTSAVTRKIGDSVTLRIGYVSPSGGFVQLIESNADAEFVLRGELTADARPDGTKRIKGRSWQSYPGRGKERALVLLEPKRTIVVLGKAPAEELAALASSLA